MPDIKLARLPDRTPVKLVAKLAPELHRSLSDYALYYEVEHGEAIALEDLVPAMLESFISGDRAFARAAREGRLRRPPQQE